MRLLAALVFTLLSCAVAMADAVGQYDIEGTNPGGGSSYSGTVAVEKTGDTYRVIWQIGNSRQVGTGIGNESFIAVSYSAGNAFGLALYGHEGNGVWRGVWTYANGRQTGTERWVPR